jgi:hypothetical protein
MKFKGSFRTAPIALACMLASAPTARAEFPVEDMNAQSLGLQYGLTFRGEDITKDNAHAHELQHMLSLAYAPVPYVSLEAGLGIDRLDIDPNRQVSFSGDFGISPGFGISLFSPNILDVLRVTAGTKALFLNSEDAKGYRYSALISTPFLGLIVSPSGYVDIEAGGRLFLMDGNMSGPQSAASRPFANGEILRGYLSVTLKSPVERAFLTLDLDASPNLDSDWSGGPREATVGVAFGAMLGGKSNVKAAATDSSRYFPAYPEMKARMEKMDEEIQ